MSVAEMPGAATRQNPSMKLVVRRGPYDPAADYYSAEYTIFHIQSSGELVDLFRRARRTERAGCTAHTRPDEISMLKGVMTSAELSQAIGAVNTRGRQRFKVPVIRALDAAHETQIGDQRYAERLLRLLAECDDWLIRHRGSNYKKRREGVKRLRDQVDALAAPIIDARRSIGADMAARRKAFARSRNAWVQARTDYMGDGRGPGEANDPRTTKGRAGFHQDLLGATVERAKVLGHSEDDFNPEQIGYLAAKVSLKVDRVLDEGARKKCKVEAMRVLCAMLGKNRELAKRFATSGIQVVVVPADRPMTDLVEFASLQGVDISQGSAPSGRTWDETRGVGGLEVGGTVFVAVTEENLLGTNTSGTAQAAGGGCYAQRYSTTSHEFAHALHQSVLTSPQKQVITDAFKAATHGVTLGMNGPDKFIRLPDTETRNGPSLTNLLSAVFAREFVDGPRRKAIGGGPHTYYVAKGASWLMYSGAHFTFTSNHELQDCYAAFDEREYFAQAVNCYLGSNGGSDPYTSNARHNGAGWLRANGNAQLVSLIDELFAAGTEGYAQALTPDTNVEEPTTLAKTVKDVIMERKAKKAFHEASMELGAIDID